MMTYMRCSSSQLWELEPSYLVLRFTTAFSRSEQARLAHVLPLAPYFPPGSHLDRGHKSSASRILESSTMINWLADAGGWGSDECRLTFSIRAMQADANTPQIPIHSGAGFYYWNSDIVSAVPLPVGGGMEGQPGYECEW